MVLHCEKMQILILISECSGTQIYKHYLVKALKRWAMPHGEY